MGHARGAQHEIAHLTADAHGMPVRALVTRGAAADCSRAIAPIDGFAAERLSADKGRDTDETLARAEKQMEAVIPPKKKPQGAARLRQGTLQLDARYAKNAASFLAAIWIGCIFLWTSIS